ncbi:hypothetical protein DIPPA_14093 [Diplonema papillatum]|nr:hypothetical protein DIPPA_14093 [Diplonema papillatum]
MHERVENEKDLKDVNQEIPADGSPFYNENEKTLDEFEPLRLNVDVFGEEGRAPPDWQERLSGAQVLAVKESWEKVPDKLACAAQIHKNVLKLKYSGQPPSDHSMDEHEQARCLLDTVEAVVHDITTNGSMATVSSLSNRHAEYHLSHEAAIVTLGEAVISSLAASLSSEDFPVDTREAWGSVSKLAIAGNYSA